MIVPTRSILTFGFFLCLSLCSCANNTIHVNIDRDDYRQKFIENLKEQNISFKVNNEHDISVFNETSKSLDEKTKNYKKYVEEDVKKQNLR